MTSTSSDLARSLAAVALSLGCCTTTLAQALACDQGIVRLPDRTGTVQICSSIAAQVPALSKQLSEAVKLLGNQQQQIRELTRWVRAVNGSGAGLDAARQAQLLQSLSAELQRAEQRGPDATRKAMEDLGEQFEGLRDQLVQSLSQPASTAATNEALRGQLGDSIAQLELRSASRQLDDLGVRLKQVQADLGAVKVGVSQANQKLDTLTAAVDPANRSERCVSLECAFLGNASVATVQRLVKNGARLPSVPLAGGMYVVEAISRPAADREALLKLLVQAGLDPALPLPPHMSNARMISAPAPRLAHTVMDRIGATPIGAGTNAAASGLTLWNQLAGCLMTWNDGGVLLSELAALLGDDDLLKLAKRLGFPPPRAELLCRNLAVEGGRATLSISINGAGAASVTVR